MNLLIRADSNESIGAGHVMRCLALAQTWQRHDRSVHFVSGDLPVDLCDRLKKEGMIVWKINAIPGSEDDAMQTLKIAEGEFASIAVVDGYQFGADYQRALNMAGLKQLFIDDYGHAEDYCADFILNQNLSAENIMYRNREMSTRLLLGTRYALLRREFRNFQRRPSARCGNGHKVLVTMGGSDADNVTVKVINALGLLGIDNIEAIVVVGSGNRNQTILRTVVGSLLNGVKGVRISLKHDVKDMSSLMGLCDLAVSAAGSTCWELAFMGLPSILIVLADNQRSIARRMNEEGAALNLGWHEEVTADAISCAIEGLLTDPEKMARMSSRAHDLVDGEGVLEVIARLEGSRFGLRRAKRGDCEAVWKLANDRVAREQSFTTEPISWDDHVKWFEGRLSSADCAFFMADDDENNPIGQARFDIDDDSAVISVNVDKNMRGKGYGSELISIASQRCFCVSSIGKIHAYIKKSNVASLNVFKRAGYLESAEMQMKGQAAYHMTLRRK